MVNSQIQQIIDNIEERIQGCNILRWILEAKVTGSPINHSFYYSHGYDEREIRIGLDLIEIYLILKKQIDKAI